MQEIIINDIHSYSKPDLAVIRHLNWNAEVNFEEKTIVAVASFTIQKQAGVKELILDTRGILIKKITINNSNAQAAFSIGDEINHLGAPLVIGINDTTEVVHVHYETGKDAAALQWLEPAQTAGKDFPFLFTQSQAILARTWIPIQDSPGIRFTFDASVKVPEGLMALMSAENPQSTSENGEYHFRMDQPIPAYLMALAVGNIEFTALGDRTGVYTEPVMMARAIYEFDDVENMLNTAENLYGTYQWDRYDLLVLPPSFPFGGMENPRLTFATPTILAGDRSLVSLVAHELAHSWSGNLVTNGSWNDFWINEGFTVYFEHRIMESLYGKAYAEMLASLAMQDLEATVKEMSDTGAGNDTKLKLNLEGRNPDDGVTSIAYDKGYFFLRQLEEMVGREKFDQFLMDYFDDNAFKAMTTESFLNYMKAHLFDVYNLEYPESMIDHWVYETGLPDNRPAPDARKFLLVDEVISQWHEGKDIKALIPTEELENNAWSTHEWLHFIRNLPDDINQQHFQLLDDHIKFTESNNSEILAAWLKISIEHDYRPAFARLDSFLINTGRRKFLTPLYTALIETEEGRILAMELYKKARPNYHAVATNSIDQLLKIE